MAKVSSTNFQCKNDRRVEIRSVEAQDAILFSEFQDRIASETQNTLRYIGQPPVDIEKTRINWDETLANKNQAKIGVFFDNKLVGYLLCNKTFPDHPWMKHLAYFAMMIIQDFWGQGLAQKLLQVLDEYAVSAGITKMEATVRCENERAFKLYEKAGYNVEGTRKNAALISGKYKDEFFIAKFY
ncbi:MAG: GNAT family N-acetyltransferase [Bdellovibrionota bacterium]